MLQRCGTSCRWHVASSHLHSILWPWRRVVLVGARVGATVWRLASEVWWRHSVTCIVTCIVLRLRNRWFVLAQLSTHGGTLGLGQLPELCLFMVYLLPAFLVNDQTVDETEDGIGHERTQHLPVRAFHDAHREKQGADAQNRFHEENGKHGHFGLFHRHNEHRLTENDKDTAEHQACNVASVMPSVPGTEAAHQSAIDHFNIRTEHQQLCQLRHCWRTALR
mmetsp:Transcript_51204/g.136699  ORF Transcript_51204/g.136699 Transcript_51204/m.136699 type:complete len:221 (+) Transcript_51204:228-890(+)